MLGGLLKGVNLKFCVWLIFVFAIAYFKLSHHELWKDEWQAWFVAKDKSVGDVFSFLYYEGHPALWYLYLKLFTVFTSTFSSIYLLNLAHWLTVASGFYFLFCKLRLPLLFAVSVALSYFFFFEYGIVNRGYFFVILFSFWASYLIQTSDYQKWHLGLVLFLLCQTEVYGVFAALAFGILLWIRHGDDIKKYKSHDIIGLGLGFLFFIISIFPRGAGHIAKTQGKELTFLDQILTSFQGNLSNTYLLGATPDTSTYGWSIAGVILSILCIIGLFYIFRRDRTLAWVYLTYLLMMFGFSVFFFTGGVRQWGLGFVFFVSMLNLHTDVWVKDLMSKVLIGIFCIFGVIHNIKAITEDVRLPFTNAKEAGLFIREKVPLKVPVVAINKFEATPVIGYAGRKFYELPEGVEFSYFRWVDKIYVPTEQELKLFAQYKNVGGIAIISPIALDLERFPSAQLWQKFDRKNYKNENYFIYLMNFIDFIYKHFLMENSYGAPIELL